MLVSGSHPHMKVSQLQKCFGGRLYCAQHCSQANFGQQLQKTFRGFMKGGRQTGECRMLVSGSHPHVKVCQLLTCFGGRLSTAVKHTWYYSSSGLTKSECWMLASGSQSTHDSLSASDVLWRQTVHSSEAHLVLQFQWPHERWSLGR